MKANDDGIVYKVSKKQRGDWSEVLCVAWLMERGYEVYHPFGEGMIDLVAYQVDERRLVRVEVKTAQPHYTKDGDLRYYWKERFTQMTHADLLLIATYEGLVVDVTGVKSPVSAATLVPDPDGHLKVGSVEEIVDHSSRRKGKGVAKRPVLDAEGNRIFYDD